MHILLNTKQFCSLSIHNQVIIFFQCQCKTHFLCYKYWVVEHSKSSVGLSIIKGLCVVLSQF